MKCKATLFALALTILLAASFSSASGQADPPTFKHFPAGKIYQGPTAPLVLARKDRTFKTRLQWAAKHLKPNFAGHYILTTWGCGAECLMGAVIDAKTGKVYWWNFTICCWPLDKGDKFGPIAFRPDGDSSSLQVCETKKMAMMARTSTYSTTDGSVKRLRSNYCVHRIKSLDRSGRGVSRIKSGN